MHKELVPSSNERNILWPEIEVNNGQFRFVQTSTLALPYCLFKGFKTAFLLQLTPHVYWIFLYSNIPRLLVWTLIRHNLVLHISSSQEICIPCYVRGLLTGLLLHSEQFFITCCSEISKHQGTEGCSLH